MIGIKPQEDVPPPPPRGVLLGNKMTVGFGDYSNRCSTISLELIFRKDFVHIYCLIPNQWTAKYLLRILPAWDFTYSPRCEFFGPIIIHTVRPICTSHIISKWKLEMPMPGIQPDDRAFTLDIWFFAVDACAWRRNHTKALEPYCILM